MAEPDPPPARRLVRVIVASPDRSLVLARPNGLAGWRLPALSVAGVRDDAAAWTDPEVTRAAAVVGGPVEPIASIAADVWEFRPTDRIAAAGTTWIAVDDVDRFGADAAVVRLWASRTSG